MRRPPARPNRRDRWTSKVVRSTLPPGTRLFLTAVLAKHMRANGQVSCPRPVLARELGSDERTVTRHITRAKEAGWLLVVRPGYRGSTAEYEAVFPNTESGTAGVPHSQAEKAGQVLPPNHGTDLSPFPGRKRDTWCPTKEVSIDTYPAVSVHDLDADGALRRDVLVLDDEKISKTKRLGRNHLRSVSA